ncbi:peptide chain release factor N(5)-glutamine methyltransferase [Novosphingobium sp. KCTC 2891]|uniref:peptide chain release factor N(5)-glutamine methyltransferase n=1 Tax=Novosphingobium sp. KCTC 2891 TaxID=2989730 RepID=UPI0022216612|nr:peptide chain release factor N(5)-glutamine methyltransferase [Novosphingobium sp. KCTC 2891]MCW1382177.1 peptide chain release factor N(5)-glutamine methyltransferase [Novosphingobium sp. KCTC 2891]
MTVAEALRGAAQRLAATSDTARLDAEVLMAHALGCSRTDVLLRRMADPAPAGFDTLVERRLMHEPVAYIVGHQDFYGLELEVSPDVLIPRGDSETLIEAAREAFAGRPGPNRVLDLGTGSGALLLAALSLWPQAQGIGIERSPGALGVARRNAASLGMASRATMQAGDWTAPGWSESLGTFDLVLANPPYIETAQPLAPSVLDFEPASALFAGADGLDDYRVLVPRLPDLLAPDGIALVEVGWTQGEEVAALADAAGLSSHLHRDLAGRERGVEMRRKP